MVSRRRAVRSASTIIVLSSLLAACGSTQTEEPAQFAAETEDVEIVTVTQYNDGTVLGPEDAEDADTADEPAPADGEAAPAPAPEADADADADSDDRAQSSALAPGEYEFIGTVEKQSTAEVLKGAPTPNPTVDLPSNRYYVLVLDEPQEVSMMKAGSDYSQVNEILALGAVDGYRDDSPTWERYVGKRVRIVASQSELSYPSDTSLPLGALKLWRGGRVEEL